jgi:homoserine O-acetyltransferase/O-succinyltransferase
MNASLEPIPPRKAGAAAHEPAAGGTSATAATREGILEVPGEVSLYHGGKLGGMHIAWRMTGPASAPVVCALGGISAHRRVCLTEDPRQSWWPQIVGPERALDSNRYRILSFDYLGGSADSTGPAAGESFASVSSYDQAEVLLRLLNHLGLKSLRAIAGGSYGGMVGLAFAQRYPERLGHLIVIGAADRANPMATAWRSVQRRIVQFASECGRAKDGLQLARALAMATYRSSEEFSARFNGPPTRQADSFLFPVEQYLFARGSDYAARYRPESFLCLSESIDLHRPSRYARTNWSPRPISARWWRVCPSGACMRSHPSTDTMPSSRSLNSCAASLPPRSGAWHERSSEGPQFASVRWTGQRRSDPASSDHPDGACRPGM